MFYAKLDVHKIKLALFLLLSVLTIGCSTSVSTPSKVTVEPISSEEALTRDERPRHHSCSTLALQKRVDRSPGSVSSLETTQNRLDALFFGNPLRWKLIQEQDGIKTFQDLESSESLVGFRGQTIIHAPMRKVASILSRQDLRKSWVEDLADTHVVRTNSNFDRVEYTHAKAPWPFQDRDFVYRATISVLKEPSSVMIRMVSVNDPNEPPKANTVRGEIKRGYYFLRETKEHETELVLEMTVNPDGVIPKWLVNLTQRQWPQKTLLALRKIAEGPNLDVAPEVENYFSAR